MTRESKAITKKRDKLLRSACSAAALSIFVVIVFSPFIVIFIETLSYLFAQGIVDTILPMLGYRRLKLLSQTIALSALAAAIASAVGILAALKLLEWRKGILLYLRWGVLLLLVIPSYIHVNAWKFVADAVNSLIQALNFTSSLNFAQISFQGFWASCFVLVSAYLPITTGLSLLGMEAVNRELVDIGRNYQSDFKVFKRLLLPLSHRFVFAGFGLVFLLSFIEYTIPSLLQYNVYSLEIFADFSATNNPVSALLLSLPLLVAALLIFGVSQISLKKIDINNIWNKNYSLKKMQWPLWFEPLINTSVAFMSAVIIVPIITLIIQTGSIYRIITIVQSSAEAFKYSILTSLLASVVAIPLSIFAAEGLRRKGKLGKVWWLPVSLPLAMPAPLVGIGLIEIWNREIFAGLYGSLLSPVLASVVRFTTISVLIIWVYGSRFDTLLMDAGKVFAKNTLAFWIGIKLPMLLPGIIAAFFTTFALSLGELGATIITAPPGKFTATIKIYNYMHYGSNDAVAGMCLVMLLISIIAGLAALFSFNWGNTND